MRRIALLDLSRGVAALIVFLGHFLAQDQHFHLHETTILYRLLELRHFCVLYFFTLSGYVLMKSLKENTAGFRWLTARLIRLYPIYLVCWIFPYFGLRILGSEDIQLDAAGTVLGLFGLQSWTRSHYLDGPNSPLWSLSVEIALSLFFLFLIKFKNPLYLISLIAVITWVESNYEIVPVLSGLPYFLLGMVLSCLKVNFTEIYVLKLLSLIAVGFFCIYTPITYAGSLNSQQPLIAIPASMSVLIMCLCFQAPVSLSRFCNYLGTRSFVLYACHAPLLWAYKRTIFGPVDGNTIEQASLLYFFGGLLVVALVSEFLYRTVDTWSISASRRMRNSVF